jgi:hypothetical protein
LQRLSLPLFAKVSATARLFSAPVFCIVLTTALASAQAVRDACPESVSATPSDGELVVGLELGDELNCALAAALAPWGLQVKQSDESSPGPSMPSTSMSARRISQSLNARIVVWLARDAEGFALWVYDARHDHAVARPVPPPPYDGPTAAALALSVKTAVRMVGAGPTEAPTDESRSQLPEQVSEPKTQASAAPAAALEPPQRAAEGPPPVASSLVGLYSAVRVDESETVRWRFGGELRLAPWRAWPDQDTRLWTGLAVELGTARSVATERYRGEFEDIGGELALGLTEHMSEQFALAVAASGALYVGTFSGDAVVDASSAEHARINPMLLVRAEGQFRFGPLGLYLQPALGYWLERQRFVAFGDVVGETPRWSARLATGLQLELN